MREIVAMVAKDMKLLLRDRMGSFFTFFFPLIMAVFFGTMFSGDSETRGIRVAVVDEDGTEESRAFVRRLGNAPELSIDSTGRAPAVEAVRLGKRTAFIALLPGFGEARGRMFYGQPPEIELGLDPSRKAESGLLQGVLTKMASERMQQVFSRPGAMRDQLRRSRGSLDSASGLPVGERRSIERLIGEVDLFMAGRDTASAPGASGASGPGWQPVRFRTTEVARMQRGPRNGYQVSFPQGVLWAMLSGAYGFALSLVLERTRGTMVRLRMAPLSRLQILLGKAVGCLLSILAISTVILLIGAVVFRVRPSSTGLLAIGVVSAAIGFVGIMMLISVMGRSQRGVSGLGWAVMMMMSMIGGGMIPLFVMPAWMQSASVISPVRWAILAIEGAMWRGFTPAQMALPCAVLLGIGVLGMVVGTRVFRWTEA